MFQKKSALCFTAGKYGLWHSMSDNDSKLLWV